MNAELEMLIQDIDKSARWADNRNADDCQAAIERIVEMIQKRYRNNSGTASLRPILTKTQMPDPHILVIIAGGPAVWTGSVWLSKSPYTNGSRIIEWPVKWWMYFPQDADVLGRPPAGPSEAAGRSAEGTIP